MSLEPSERRLAENEVVFRQLNEQVQKGIDEINKLADDSGQPELRITQEDGETPLYFYCECSDENCTSRLPVGRNKYNQVHQRRDHFIVLPGHEVLSVEKIVEQTPSYCVVEKDIQPPESVGRLHDTEIDNT
jgi:hypothetical protein